MSLANMSDNITVKEIQAKSILNKSGIPGMTYCLNPYTGCSHGCIYCYATFMRDYSNHTEEWGHFVDVKINLLEILSREVKKKKTGHVCIGTVADPYQTAEQKYQLTRLAIKILKEHNFPFEILTKSSLIVRDLDLIKDYDNCSVEITITTIDDNIRKLFEPNADSVENRLLCLEKLVSAGIKTSVFFGPVLPYFSDNDEAINKIFDTLEAVSIKRILVDKLNYQDKKVPIIIEKLKSSYPNAIGYYQDLMKKPNNYEGKLRQRILKIAQNKKINVEVLF